jgi:phospholipid/cholesterol/gamma-HCH transport system substrate-binding protein
MNILRTEIRTGLLVVLSLAALVALLLYLGAPGVFVPQKTFRIYFDNAAGLEPGAPVLLAGRKIGQVRKLYSPVPEQERPTPKMETLVEVQVTKAAQIFLKVKAQMTQPSLLGKHVIDFTSGEEASGLAPDGTTFLGERQGGLADAVPSVLEKIDPALTKVTATLDSLQKVADNLTKITGEGSDLPAAFAEFRKFGTNLNDLSGPESSLRRSLQNVEAITGEDGKLGKALDRFSEITGPGSDLTKTLSNAEKFTANLSNNKDIEVSLRNFRSASENFDRQLTRLGGQFSDIASNLEQATETVKTQPWRLIWPSTKKYEGESRASTPTPRPKSKAARR